MLTIKEQMPRKWMSAFYGRSIMLGEVKRVQEALHEAYS